MHRGSSISYAANLLLGLFGGVSEQGGGLRAAAVVARVHVVAEARGDLHGAVSEKRVVLGHHVEELMLRQVAARGNIRHPPSFSNSLKLSYN